MKLVRRRGISHNDLSNMEFRKHSRGVNAQRQTGISRKLTITER